MISDILFPRLLDRFTSHGARVESSKAPTVIIPAKSPDFGDLVIQDDADEITVFVGRFTHVHFACYDDAKSDPEKQETIASDVIAFVEQVTADEIVAWGSHLGGGGCHKKKTKRGFLSRFRSEYVWSGKLH